MDLGVREVGDAAGVIEVEMRGDDVADVGRVVAQRLDLANRGLTLLADRGDQRAEGLAEPLGVCVVAQAEAGVDQDQLAARLDQQAMGDDRRPLQQSAAARHQTRPPRAHRSAIEVLDLDDAGA